jgi:hypothetical protein
MGWRVELWEEFAAELAMFPQSVRVEIAALAGLLEQFGPTLRRPHCDTLKGSKHHNLKELRFSGVDGVWRVAFAFDPERQAILLAGASKSGVNQRRFYLDLIQKADDRYDRYLASHRSKSNANG